MTKRSSNFSIVQYFMQPICALLAIALLWATPAGSFERVTSQDSAARAFEISDNKLPAICFGNGTPFLASQDHCDECILAGNKALASNIVGSIFNFVIRNSSHVAARSRPMDYPLRTLDNPTRGPPNILIS